MSRWILVGLVLVSALAAVPGLEGRERAPRVASRVHMSQHGWQGWVRGEDIAGAPDRGLQVEAIRLRIERVPGSIRYSVHAKGIGWTDWAEDGQIAGTTGEKRRVEAIRLELAELPDWSVAYRVCLRGHGWSEWAHDGEVAGTTGQEQAVEAVEIRLETRRGLITRRP
ncbi:MAG TPA: hypothetical protein P5234_14700 [Thermoanaerobaculaceae bacterium]|nr:hypothetical protein [Thermoanaerobaculaceae bacterium]HRS17482.1 hypothetical protein [Thermoanaerobaculaceae bacterium]